LAQAAPELGDITAAEVAEGAAVVGKSPGQLFWRRFRQDKFAFVGLGFIIMLLAASLTAPFIAENVLGHGPNDTFAEQGQMLDEFGLPKGPNSQFWFGADDSGRDVFLRVIYGARTSLEIAILATGLALVIGVTLGLVGGFFRGKIDTLISRTADVMLALPVLMLALGLASACSNLEGCAGGYLRPGLGLVAIIIGLFSWPYICRIVRGQVLSLREKEFIEAARAQGAGSLRIMMRELLPNLVAPIIVYTTLIIPNNILFEAALSFLGAGVPPETPSWGQMLDDATAVYTVAWWTMVFPGLFLFLTTLSFNLLGDGLRDALDPRGSR
jgi:peptide/nickel transport system permease protein